MSSDAHALPTKIVLVIVETMGAPRGATARQMFAPLLSDAIERRFDTHTGLVPFFGATTSGELRELCGVAMNHFVAEIATLDCLPHRLRALGYESVAIHGYKASLMQRERWWPRVGFDRILFGDSLQRGRTLPECGALFHGVCDSSIVAVIREELTRQPARKQLVYWLTLSSHFPLTRRPPSSAPSCTALGSAGREREICALWDALWPTLTGLAGLAADTTIPRAWYILVGDHAPPWLMADTTLFDQRRVPLLELRPKR